MWRGKDTELRGDKVDAVSLNRLAPEKKKPENPPKLPDQNHDPPSKWARKSIWASTIFTKPVWMRCSITEQPVALILGRMRASCNRLVWLFQQVLWQRKASFLAKLHWLMVVKGSRQSVEEFLSRREKQGKTQKGRGSKNWIKSSLRQWGRWGGWGKDQVSNTKRKTGSEAWAQNSRKALETTVNSERETVRFLAVRGGSQQGPLVKLQPYRVVKVRNPNPLFFPSHLSFKKRWSHSASREAGSGLQHKTLCVNRTQTNVLAHWSWEKRPNDAHMDGGRGERRW